MRMLHMRLPFAIDLVALMLEAGGEIRECLSKVVEENKDHPLGIEFGRIHQDMESGSSLLESVTLLQERLADDSFNEIAFSIRSSQELGTPLGKTFLNLASQMRLKRSQHAEKLVGEAATMLPLANLIIMLAGMLAITGPYAIKMINDAPF